MAALRNVEADEAGRLRAFRNKFGRGWDAEAVEEDDTSSSSSSPDSATPAKKEDTEDSLMDLISSQYSSNATSDTRNKIDIESEGGNGSDGTTEKKTITVKNRETGKLEKVELTGTKAVKEDKKRDGSRGFGGSS
jgi:hypothetical protein